MKRNLRFEMEFPISTFLLSILAKNNTTDSRIDGKGFTNCNKTLGRAQDPRANGAWLSKLTE